MASEAPFDPYRKWLGIPPSEQPPNYYRLLGIPLFECDPDVIINAADRQMGHVRRFQAGRYAEACQKILNELAAARVCLLDPVRKREYDQKLFFEFRAKGIPLPLPVATPLAENGIVATPQAGADFSPPLSVELTKTPESLSGSRASGPPVSVLMRRRRRDVWRDPALAVGLGVVFLVILVLTVLVIFRHELFGQ